MKFNQREVVETREHIIEIREAEPLPVRFSRDGKHYRPDLLVAKWTRSNGGDWTERRVSLSGTVLRKDGSDSKNRVSHTLWSRDARPDWVADILATLAPTTTESEAGK